MKTTRSHTTLAPTLSLGQHAPRNWWVLWYLLVSAAVAGGLLWSARARTTQELSGILGPGIWAREHAFTLPYDIDLGNLARPIHTRCDRVRDWLYHALYEPNAHKMGLDAGLTNLSESEIADLKSESARPITLISNSKLKGKVSDAQLSALGLLPNPARGDRYVAWAGHYIFPPNVPEPPQLIEPIRERMAHIARILRFTYERLAREAVTPAFVYCAIPIGPLVTAPGAESSLLYIGYPTERVPDDYDLQSRHWLRAHAMKDAPLQSPETGTAPPITQWTPTYLEPGTARPVITYSTSSSGLDDKNVRISLGALAVDIDTETVSSALNTGWPIALNFCLLWILTAALWAVLEMGSAWERFRSLLAAFVLLHLYYLYRIAIWSHPQFSIPWDFAGIALDTFLSLTNSAGLIIAALQCFHTDRTRPDGTWSMASVSRLSAILNRYGGLFEGFFATIVLGATTTLLSMILHVIRPEGAKERELIDALAGCFAVLFFGYRFCRWVRQFWKVWVATGLFLIFLFYGSMQLPYSYSQSSGTYWWWLLFAKLAVLLPVVIAVYDWISNGNRQNLVLLSHLSRWFGSFARLGVTRTTDSRTGHVVTTRTYRVFVAADNAHHISFCDRYLAALVGWVEGVDYSALHFGDGFIRPDPHQWTLSRLLVPGQHEMIQSRLRAARFEGSETIINCCRVTVIAKDRSLIPATLDILAWREPVSNSSNWRTLSVGMLTIQFVDIIPEACERRLVQAGLEPAIA